MTFGYDVDSIGQRGSMKESKHSVVSSIKSENPLNQFKELERSQAFVEFQNPYTSEFGKPALIQSQGFVQKLPKHDLESAIRTEFGDS